MEPGEARPTTSRRAVVLAAVALVALVFLVHGRVLGTDWGFCFDDVRFIRRNPYVTGPTPWLDFFTDMRTTDPHSPAGIVRPLRTLEFALDARLFGMDPRAFHAHSLAWFSVGVVFLMLLFRDIVGDVRAAFAGAALWAAHPMQTECAQLISSRGDVAAGALTVASVWAAVRSRGRDRWLAVSLVAAATAMLFKESAIVAPLLVVLVRCVTPRSGTHGAFGRSLVASWPWFVVSAVYLAYHDAVQVGGMTHVRTYVLGGSTAGTFATMFRAFGAYVLFALLPARPTVDWHLLPSSSLAEPAVVGWLAVHAGLLAWGFAGLRRGRAAGAAVLWFYAALLPVANWPFYLGIPTAERFLHVALAGLALTVALWVRSARRASWTAYGAAATVVAACGGISFVRAADWTDNLTLWRATEHVVESPRAEGFLAAEVRRDGVAALAAARRLPEGPERERAEAAALALLEEALAHAHRALSAWARIEGSRTSDTLPVAHPHVNASNVCFLLGRPGEALFHADEAIRIAEAVDSAAHYNRALALLELGRGAAACRSLVRALDLGFDASDEVGMLLERAAALCESDGETEMARAALTKAAAFPGTAGPRARDALQAFESRVSARLGALRDALARDGSDRTRAALAVALAADGRISEADRVAGSVAGGRPVGEVAPVLWVHARWAARGTPEGWKDAVGLLARADTADAVYLRARCEEELQRDADALRDFERVLALLGPQPSEADPRAVHARAAAARLRTPCPWFVEGALPSGAPGH